MSQQDLQFIERALAHHWMFWVYFWKWPRIVRQACAEYDLLAKERDAAKAAHERSERANKIVRDWIHVTHRLSTTPEAIRAIFAAGKRLSILLVFFVVTNAFGQAPPYLRNQWTTNANPLALKVISTNGVHAATNVWELDFTNTATVTVSAVSNANKVMVSFTGAASGGDTIWTNDGTQVMIIADTNRVRHFLDYTEFGTNALNVVRLTNGAITAHAYFEETLASDSPNSRPLGRRGGITGASFWFATNCTTFANDGAGAFGWFDSVLSCDVEVNDGGVGGGFFDSGSTNCEVDSIGSMSFGRFSGALASSISATYGSFSGGNFSLTTNVTLQGIRGCLSFGSLENSRDIDIAADRAGFGIFFTQTGASNVVSDVNRGSFATVRLSGVTNNILADNNSFVFGSLASNERFHAPEGAFMVGRDLAGTNNWTFGIHYTNTVPLSLAVGANGTTQFRAASNSVVIRSSTAPTVGQILTATDTSGTVGWSNAPAASGGGIASIFTNNVLAGGPGLTELEFTNTATVTWAATTNAGRVTMSATSAGGGSGIATNAGTGWNTSFLQPSVTDKAVTVTQISGSKTNTVEILGAAGGVGTFGTNLLSIAGGVITNDSRLIDSSATWSNSAVTFTGIRMNITDTASAAGSLLMDFRKSGTSKFTIDRLGNVASTDINGWTLTGHANGTTVINGSSSVGFGNVGNGITFMSNGRLHWSETSNPFGATKAIVDSPSVGTIRVFTNLTVQNVTTSASYASSATNRIVITATGYTNTMTILGIAVDVDVYFDAATATLSDSAGNAMHTFQAGTNITVHLKPNWRLAGTTMAGTAIAH